MILHVYPIKITKAFRKTVGEEKQRVDKSRILLNGGDQLSRINRSKSSPQLVSKEIESISKRFNNLYDSLRQLIILNSFLINQVKLQEQVKKGLQIKRRT